MSIQWTFIAGYLYFEVGVVSIMMLPIACPRRWQQFFRSRLFAMFREHAAIYFYVLLSILSLFLLDAVREMRKYSSNDANSTHLAAELKNHVKLFRAQRNFYITGLAIFLSFVIRRLVTMTLIQAELLDKSERIIREAGGLVQIAASSYLTRLSDSRLARTILIPIRRRRVDLSLLASRRSGSNASPAESAKDLAKTTVLSQALQSAGDANNMDNLEKLLPDVKNRVKGLEEEVSSLKQQLSRAICDSIRNKSE